MRWKVQLWISIDGRKELNASSEEEREELTTPRGDRSDDEHGVESHVQTKRLFNTKTGLLEAVRRWIEVESN